MWNAAAPGRVEWWPTIDEALQVVSDRLVELAGLRAGDRVLDIGTGTGEPAVTAARRVGAAGHVVAIDVAPEMLAAAAERASALGLDNVELRELDAAELELPGESFDAVLSRFALMFMEDVVDGFRRLRRVLAPGGGLAAAVWGPPARVPFLAVPIRAARSELGLPPPAPGAPGPFALADRHGLERALAQAGFEDVASEVLTVEPRFASASDCRRFHAAVCVPVQTLVADETPERRTEVWAAVEREARRYAGADGSVALPSEVVCVAGRAAG